MSRFALTSWSQRQTNDACLTVPTSPRDAARLRLLGIPHIDGDALACQAIQRWRKRCSCGREYREESWLRLASLGVRSGLDWRNCEKCGSTLAVEVQP